MEILVRSRTVEFEGPEQLAEAGQTLLHDKGLDAVVVRGCIEQPDAFLKEDSSYTPTTNKDPADLYEKVPQLSELDEVVAKWWQENPRFLKAFNPLAGVQQIGYTSSRAGPHIDTRASKDSRVGVVGPLRLSIRMDASTSNEQRIFYARRLSPLLANWLYELRGPEIEKPRLRMTAIDHRVGDAVLFTNHPIPTIHAVEMPTIGGLIALIASYQFKHKE